MREDPEAAIVYARHRALYIYPYYGPWSWMNDTAIRTVDAVVEAAMVKYQLSAGIPIVATGGSMGGLGALVYTVYAARTPVACAVNSPVCDLLYHYTEREDVPRTLYHAFAHYPCDLETAIASSSPLHLAYRMPDIPYYLVHGFEDREVSKQAHSDAFFQTLHTIRRIQYIEVPGMNHCALRDDQLERYYAFVFSYIG